MRKILFLCILAMACVQVRAQHIHFKGIRLGEDIVTFRLMMLEKGFAINDRRTDAQGSCSFVGKFAGDFVDVSCSYTPETKKVFKVGVDFKRWTVALDGKAGVTRNQQNGRFDELYKAISNNFGKPVQDQRVARGGVERLAVWRVQGGTINLVLHNIQGKYITLSLVYHDDEAMALLKSEKKQA